MPASVSLMAALTKLMARSRWPPLLGAGGAGAGQAADRHADQHIGGGHQMKAEHAYLQMLNGRLPARPRC